MPPAQQVSCYNKGCGIKFDPSDNGDESCCFHTGAPIFHDAYKSWSCCNKKSSDFTEFLNFKGCSKGKHSNEKPAEPIKKVEAEIELPIVEDRKPIDTLKRPPFDTPCIKIEPIINATFKKQMDGMDLTNKSAVVNDGTIAIGTSCKRGGCTHSYDSPASDESICVFHPGFPIFHEGYKFWSCCQKKTSDFSAFLSQVGCETGKHKWIQEQQSNLECRWDWHQTASDVVVAVYAKNYDYKQSFVKVSPVRLMVKLSFPLQANAKFNIDLELRGIVDASKATAHMYGTKVEITMPKAEGVHWSKLDFPRDTPKEQKQADPVNNDNFKDKPKVVDVKKVVEDDDSDVDLDDLELVQGARLMELGELARSCQLVEES